MSTAYPASSSGSTVTVFSSSKCVATAVSMVVNYTLVTEASAKGLIAVLIL